MDHDNEHGYREQGAGRPAPTAYSPPPIQPPPARSGGSVFFHSCLAAGCATILAPVLLVGGFFIMLYFLIAPGVVQEASGTIDALYQSSGRNVMEKIIRRGEPGSGVIAVISIQGEIAGNGSPIDGSGMLDSVSEQLRTAGEDDSVKAVLLQIDSPGGGLTASDQLHHEVASLRKKGKKVVAWAGSIMASGGYYIALGAEKIVACPTATVGSIGVIMQHFDLQELLGKIGVKVDPIVSGNLKDIGSAFRAMTPEERQLLQDYVDAANRRFVKILSESRGLSLDQARKLADGGIHTAEGAMANGMIDRIGYIEDALDATEELAGGKNMRVVAYRRFPSLRDLLREAGQGAAGVVYEKLAPESRAGSR